MVGRSGHKYVLSSDELMHLTTYLTCDANVRATLLAN